MILAGTRDQRGKQGRNWIKLWGSGWPCRRLQPLWSATGRPHTALWGCPGVHGAVLLFLISPHGPGWRHTLGWGTGPGLERSVLRLPGAWSDHTCPWLFRAHPTIRVWPWGKNKQTNFPRVYFINLHEPRGQDQNWAIGILKPIG